MVLKIDRPVNLKTLKEGTAFKPVLSATTPVPKPQQSYQDNFMRVGAQAPAQAPQQAPPQAPPEQPQQPGFFDQYKAQAQAPLQDLQKQQQERYDMVDEERGELQQDLRRESLQAQVDAIPPDPDLDKMIQEGQAASPLSKVLINNENIGDNKLESDADVKSVLKMEDTSFLDFVEKMRQNRYKKFQELGVNSEVLVHPEIAKTNQRMDALYSQLDALDNVKPEIYQTIKNAGRGNISYRILSDLVSVKTGQVNDQIDNITREIEREQRTLNLQMEMQDRQIKESQRRFENVLALEREERLERDSLYDIYSDQRDEERDDSKKEYDILLRTLAEQRHRESDANLERDRAHDRRIAEERLELSRQNLALSAIREGRLAETPPTKKTKEQEEEAEIDRLKQLTPAAVTQLVDIVRKNTENYEYLLDLYDSKDFWKSRGGGEREDVIAKINADIGKLQQGDEAALLRLAPVRTILRKLTKES